MNESEWIFIEKIGNFFKFFWTKILNKAIAIEYEPLISNQ